MKLVGSSRAIAMWQAKLRLAPRQEVLGLVGLLLELFGDDEEQIQHELMAALETSETFRESLSMWRRINTEEARQQRLQGQANFRREGQSKSTPG